MKQKNTKIGRFSPCHAQIGNSCRSRGGNVPYADKLDANLPETRKIWLYKNGMRFIAAFLRKKGVAYADAEDMASAIYFKIMNRRGGDVFPRGIPETDGEWMAFMKKASEHALMSNWARAKRHPTVSLGEPIYNGEDGDGFGMTLGDVLPDENADEYRFRPEVRMELPNVRKAVSLICNRRNYKGTTRRIVERILLEGDSVADVAKDCNVTANNVYAIKFRAMDAFRKEVPWALAALEQSA